MARKMADLKSVYILTFVVFVLQIQATHARQQNDYDNADADDYVNDQKMQDLDKRAQLLNARKTNSLQSVSGVETRPSLASNLRSASENNFESDPSSPSSGTEKHRLEDFTNNEAAIDSGNSQHLQADRAVDGAVDSRPAAKGKAGEQTGDPCKNTCENGGSCQADPGQQVGFICFCSEKYTGTVCQFELVLCEDLGCSEILNCANRVSGPVCDCLGIEDPRSCRGAKARSTLEQMEEVVPKETRGEAAFVIILTVTLLMVLAGFIGAVCFMVRSQRKKYIDQGMDPLPGRFKILAQVVNCPCCSKIDSETTKGSKISTHEEELYATADDVLYSDEREAPDYHAPAPPPPDKPPPKRRARNRNVSAYRYRQSPSVASLAPQSYSSSSLDTQRHKTRRSLTPSLDRSLRNSDQVQPMRSHSQLYSPCSTRKYRRSTEPCYKTPSNTSHTCQWCLMNERLHSAGGHRESSCSRCDNEETESEMDDSDEDEEYEIHLQNGKSYMYKTVPYYVNRSQNASADSLSPRQKHVKATITSIPDPCQSSKFETQSAACYESNSEDEVFNQHTFRNAGSISPRKLPNQNRNMNMNVDNDGTSYGVYSTPYTRIHRQQKPDIYWNDYQGTFPPSENKNVNENSFDETSLTQLNEISLLRKPTSDSTNMRHSYNSFDYQPRKSLELQVVDSIDGNYRIGSQLGGDEHSPAGGHVYQFEKLDEDIFMKTSLCRECQEGNDVNNDGVNDPPDDPSSEAKPAVDGNRCVSPLAGIWSTTVTVSDVEDHSDEDQDSKMPVIVQGIQDLNIEPENVGVLENCVNVSYNNQSCRATGSTSECEENTGKYIKCIEMDCENRHCVRTDFHSGTAVTQHRVFRDYVIPQVLPGNMGDHEARAHHYVLDNPGNTSPHITKVTYVPPLQMAPIFYNFNENNSTDRCSKPADISPELALMLGCNEKNNNSENCMEDADISWNLPLLPGCYDNGTTDTCSDDSEISWDLPMVSDSTERGEADNGCQPAELLTDTNEFHEFTNDNCIDATRMSEESLLLLEPSNMLQDPPVLFENKENSRTDTCSEPAEVAPALPLFYGYNGNNNIPLDSPVELTEPSPILPVPDCTESNNTDT